MADLATAVGALNRLPRKQNTKQAIIHLQNAQHLIAETVELLRGTKDMQNIPLNRRDCCGDNIEDVRNYLHYELRELKNTALMAVEAAQDQRADVMFAQSVFTQARIEITQAVYWLGPFKF